MTLKDIKDQIAEQLSKLTIDDFYLDTEISIAKQTFSKLTKLNTDKEIKKFLTDKFPETTIETIRESLQQTIKEKEKDVALISDKMTTLQEKIKLIIKKVHENEKKQKAITIAENKTNLELAHIKAEIKQIKPLAGKSPYKKQMEELEKEKGKKEKEHANYPITISNLKDEIRKLQAEINKEMEIISKKEKGIKDIKSEILKNQKELNEINKEGNTYYHDEYSALDFLFTIVLRVSIRKSFYEKIKTGKIVYDSKRGEMVDEYTNWGYTDNPSLEIGDLTKENFHKFVLPFVNEKNIIPKDWRKILHNTLSVPIDGISGTLSLAGYRHNNDYKMTYTDISILLATKIATKGNPSMKLGNNKIILALSGGLIAVISFRKKGNLISKYQKEKPIEIFAKQFGTNQYVLKTLYLQTGYANSEIQIETPEGFCILTEKFVIEIQYEAAPVLFGNNSILQYAPNISAKAKADDEEQALRQQEDDDWYDDY